MDMSKTELKIKGEPKQVLSIRVHPELAERLEAYCAEGSYVRNSVCEKALEEFLDREDKKKKTK